MSPAAQHTPLTTISTILFLAHTSLTTGTTTPSTIVTTIVEKPGVSRRQAMSMSAGSSCDGSEGQWNCMTSSFQRCGSGQWSEVQQCALGTHCSPSGLTYQFHVDFADGYLGAAPQPPPTTSRAPPRGGGGAGGGAIVKWMLLCGLAVTALILIS
ncbi:hypothetical protein GQX73_g8420 [Xylaria multiplex]|uniref:Extracellular membrane protein CFEM domain-containing protein n=1 Tax=Xylaria multiplex TaxID=323545 RepID=A0A7C8IJM9_9PEZI|nr:hypothetical protein GQX73_g8420 [Xylaria multiplex]